MRTFDGMMVQSVKLVECPRDAMQGWKTLIPTSKKIEYIRSLMQVGFDTIDFGSFVSGKAIPQMADTSIVVQSLESVTGNSKLLAIVANLRGAEEACLYERISYLGYPFSVSETFQLRNTNASIGMSLERVADIQNLCIKNGKKLVVYISMGFGNPYGDPYSDELVFEWVSRLVALDIGIISLADTVGMASAEQVFDLTSFLTGSFPATEIGVHLHARPEQWKEKLEAALKAGCMRFDGALKGIGGCPMADDELVGNLDTEQMIGYLEKNNLIAGLDKSALAESLRIAGELFA